MTLMVSLIIDVVFLCLVYLGIREVYRGARAWVLAPKVRAEQDARTAARAERQHREWMSGDPHGTVGEFPVVEDETVVTEEEKDMTDEEKFEMADRIVQAVEDELDRQYDENDFLPRRYREWINTTKLGMAVFMELDSRVEA